MGIKVELFSSPACGKCDQVKKTLQKIADGSEGAIEFVVVNILEKMDYALQIGVLSTPCVAINGKLEFFGLPPIAELKQMLDDRLPKEKK